MNNKEIDKKLGSWQDRQDKTILLAKELVLFFRANNFKVFEPINLNESIKNKKVLETIEKENYIAVEYRAKTNKSIIDKLSRYNESLDEILDLFGLRIVVNNTKYLDRVSNIIIKSLWDIPSKEEMIIRNGTMFFAPIRDYRKRDWQGVGPATSGGYNDAVHINKKSKYGIVEIQIMTLDLFKKYFDPKSSENHDKFKSKQMKIYKN